MILSSLITSCTNNTIDLSLFEKIDAKNLSNLKLKRVENQVGSWKYNNEKEDVELEKNNKFCKIFYINNKEEINQLNFSNLKIDKSSGSKIIVYDDKVSFFKLNFIDNETFTSLKFLKEKLGNDFKSFKKPLSVDGYHGQINILKNEQNNEFDFMDDDIEGKVAVFSDFYYWDKKDFIVTYRIGLTRDGFSNNIIFTTKKALKDKIVFGYHNIENDPYLKNIKL